MISIAYATLEESSTVVALWNAKRLDSASCWQQAEPIDDAYVAQLLSAGMALVIARADGLPVGFGLWLPVGAEARLVALAADDDEIYYRLMAEFCAWGIALQHTIGFAELDSSPTTERARMDALGVIQYVPIGYEPLAPGQTEQSRAARLLRAQCELAVLAQAVTARLEGQP